MQRYTSDSAPSSASTQHPVSHPPGAGVDLSDTAAPPHNLEAEQALLGAILLNNAALDRVPPTFVDDHFYDPLHRAIFFAARQSIQSGRLATPITLKSFFEATPPIRPDLTVPQYLGQLAANAGTIISVADYARTVSDLAHRRQLILIGEDLAATAQDSAIDYPPLELIEESEGKLFALAQSATGEVGVSLTFGEAATEGVRLAEATARGERRGLSTGLIDLDIKLGGMQATDLIILAGRPAMGKSALATNIAVHVAKSLGLFVDFYSLEMSPEQLALRQLASDIEVPSDRMRTGKLSSQQLEALARAAHALQDLPLSIDKTGGISIAQLSARARRTKRRKNTGLIVVDYLQLMQASRRRSSGNRVEDITEITTGLKALAKELSVPVLALSQLSRNVEHRDNKRPQLSDLRESGSIEQDADVVMFVYREEYYLEKAQPAVSDPSAYADWQSKMAQAAGKAEIILGKQRHGPVGIVPVAFSGEFTRFSNLAREGNQ